MNTTTDRVKAKQTVIEAYDALKAAVAAFEVANDAHNAAYQTNSDSEDELFAAAAAATEDMRRAQYAYMDAVEAAFP